MDGWMDELMVESVDGWIDRWIYGWMDELMDRWIERGIDNRQIEKWIDYIDDKIDTTQTQIDEYLPCYSKL